MDYWLRGLMDQVHQAAGLPLVRKTVFGAAGPRKSPKPKVQSPKWDRGRGGELFFDMGLKGLRDYRLSHGSGACLRLLRRGGIQHGRWGTQAAIGYSHLFSLITAYYRITGKNFGACRVSTIALFPSSLRFNAMKWNDEKTGAHSNCTKVSIVPKFPRKNSAAVRGRGRKLR